MSSVDFDDEVESLKSVLERLDDFAMDALQGFIDSGDSSLKDREKRIHRARRAVAKAISELSPPRGSQE